MIVTNQETGERWVTVAEAACTVHVHKDTIWAWATRGKVRRHNVDGKSWVCLDDVLDAERAWRKRAVSQTRRQGVR